MIKIQSDISNLRVFVVEDEPLIAMFIADSLSDIGCTMVGTAASLSEAKNKLAEVACDLVMLDVNLNGTQTISLAETLHATQKPFIFSTGYGNSGIPSHLRHIPVLQKPFQESDLIVVLRSAMNT